MTGLNLRNVKISVGDKEIIHGLDLKVRPGEVHVIMGPNGSGKSTLANALMGHPKYKISGGEVTLDDENLETMSVDLRARKGLFLSMQYIPEVSGVTITNFLRTAKESLIGTKIHPIKFYDEICATMKNLGINIDFASRYLNVGFSGGEKKRMEILQLLTLQPRYAILDETDSGLDVDALKFVSDGINKFRSPKNAVLIITHYNRILEFVKPDFVHVMVRGKIVASGGAELAKLTEEQGFSAYESK